MSRNDFVGAGCVCREGNYTVVTLKLDGIYPLSSKCGAYKRVKARFWPWLSGKSS